MPGSVKVRNNNKIPYLDHLVVIKIPDVTEGRLKTFTNY